MNDFQNDLNITSPQNDSTQLLAIALEIAAEDFQDQQMQMLRNFSHELRTPLTIVYGYMQSIYRRSENLTDLQKDALESAILEMSYAIKLLQECLDLARLEVRETSLKIASIPLQSLILETIATFNKLHQREISFNSYESCVSVLADGEYLKEVLFRLFDNAVKYSKDTISISLDNFGDYVAINVCDRGCGIDIQDRERIFKPFYRADRSRSRLSGGSGLGLALSKVLVERMGGNLNVTSQRGKGSTFKVMLKSST